MIKFCHNNYYLGMCAMSNLNPTFQFQNLLYKIQFAFQIYLIETSEWDEYDDGFVHQEEYINVGIYNVCEMIVCTLYEDYFACMDKREKKRYLFNYSDIDRILFANRLEALTLVTDAEKDKPKVSNERFYEED